MQNKSYHWNLTFTNDQTFLYIIETRMKHNSVKKTWRHWRHSWDQKKTNKKDSCAAVVILTCTDKTSQTCCWQCHVKNVIAGETSAVCDPSAMSHLFDVTFCPCLSVAQLTVCQHHRQRCLVTVPSRRRRPLNTNLSLLIHAESLLDFLRSERGVAERRKFTLSSVEKGKLVTLVVTSDRQVGPL